MKAVILAGGMGTRLQPIIGLDKPKVMLEYGGKPLLQRTIEMIRDKGIKELVLVVSHNKEYIMNYFGDGSNLGVKIDYAVQANPKGGTADATRCAENKINEDKFMLIYGDNIFNSDAIDMVLSKKDSFSGVMGVKEVTDPRKYGVLDLNGRLVKKIIEKPANPPSNLVMTGIFVMPREIFTAIRETGISPRGEYELTDSIQKLIDKKVEIGYVIFPSYWLDPQNKEDIDKAKQLVAHNSS